MRGLATLYLLWRGREGLGLGDVKLIAVSGAWLSLAAALHAITLAALAALALCGVFLVLGQGRMRNKTAVPFTAFLAPPFWMFG